MTSVGPPLPAIVEEKIHSAERALAWIRIAAAGLATLHRAAFGPLSTYYDPAVIGVLAAAWVYAPWTLIARPYRRWPLLSSRWFTTITDASFITAFALFTGGAGSPWYAHYYVALAMIGFRFGLSETFGSAAVFAAAYAALAVAVQGSLVALTDGEVWFRAAMLLLIAGTIGPLARESLAQQRRRLSLVDGATRAQQAVAELHGHLEDAGTGIVVLDDAGRVEFANAEARRLLGAGAAAGASVATLASAFADPAAAARHVAEPPRDEPLLLAGEGSRFARVGASAYGAGHGRIVVVEDVTERLRLERELRAARFHMEELERRRIARELHDEVGEVLTGLHLVLDRMAGGDVAASGPRPEELLDKLLDRVQSMSLDLRPPVLDDLGLQPAVQTLVERFGVNAGIEVEVRFGVSGRFAPDVEITAYRVVQESLTNVARYARAKRVSVRAWAAGDVLTLQVEDDGIGIEASKNPDAADERRYKGTGSGLAAMRERVGLLGGSVQVESSKGNGTRITVEIPSAVRSASAGP